MPNASSPQSLSFFDHLEELRARILQCLLAFLVSLAVVYGFTDALLEILVRPVGRLVFVSPGEAFLARMTLTLFSAFFLSLPVILYHVWRFVSIGLTPPERMYVRMFGPLSLILFLAGALFAYAVIVPLSLRFLLGFASPSMVPMITVEKYISFVGSFLVAFGVVFELPLIIMFLAKIGIATPEFLRQKRRHAIVLILIVSAILTPPDIMSQILMALPLLVLYETSILLVNFAGDRKKTA